MTDSPEPSAIELRQVDLIRAPRSISDYDEVASALEAAREPAIEEDALAALWGRGEEGRLHEDCRFAPTPWGRWRLTHQPLANDRLVRRLLRGDWDGTRIAAELASLDREHGGRHVFDPGDPRFHQVADRSRWTLSDLPLRPAVAPGESPPDGTWVEILTLTAAAGRLGGSAEVVERLGWVAIRGTVPEDAFVARIAGASMEPGLPDGSYAVFRPAEPESGVVLAVHADFADDDLVSCTVKRARRDARGQVTLSSDNPAYRDRPILPAGASWEDVRRVAVLERALEPKDFIGLPGSRPSRVDRGPLTEADLERRLRGLRDRAARLATPRVGARPAGSPGARELPTDWEPPVLAVAADGTSLRWTYPGWDLPAELGRQVAVAGRPVSLGNLRRPGFVTVPPQHASYTVEARQAPPAAVERLLSLRLPGLPADRASVFRAPAGGHGTLLAEPELQLGRTYRLLVPPSLSEAAKSLVDLSGGAVLGAIDGWPVVELEVRTDVDPAWAAELAKLGLRCSTGGVWLDLVGAMPERFDQTPSGAVVPVFDGGRLPVVKVSAGEPCERDQVHLLVACTGSEARLALPAGDSWLVQLEDIAPGIVVVEVRASDRELAHDQRVLLVEQLARPVPPIRGAVVLESEAGTWPLAGPAPAHRDLRAWTTQGVEEPTVAGPPLWPIVLRWGVGAQLGQTTLRLDETGALRLPLGEVDALVAEHVHAWVCVDAGELGQLLLLHIAEADVDGLAGTLRRLDSQRGVPLSSLLGAGERFDRWARSVLQALGYLVGVPAVRPRAVVAGLARTSIVQDRIEQEELGLLWVVDETDDALRTDASRRVDALIAEAQSSGADVALLTNGATWLRVEPRRRIPRRRWADLGAALTSPYDAQLIEFVQEFMA